MTQPLHSPLGGIALNAIRWRSGEPDIGYAILRDDVRWLLRYIAEAEAAAPDPVASPLDPMTLIEMLYEEVRRLDELSDPDGSLAEALSFRRAGVKFSIGKVKSWAATPSKMAGEGQPVAEEPA